MSFEVIVDKQVSKQLTRIPKKDAVRILAAMHECALNPYAGDIQKMAGEKDVWRRRVGSFRIFYEVKMIDRVVYIYDVKRRTSNTY